VGQCNSGRWGFEGKEVADIACLAACGGTFKTVTHVKCILDEIEKWKEASKRELKTLMGGAAQAAQ